MGAVATPAGPSARWQAGIHEEERSRRIDGICVVQMDLFLGVETNTGLRGLRE